MSAHRMLIVYGTTWGQTAKIAAKIGELLTNRGCAVTLAKGDELPRDLRVEEYDGVIVGASMIARRYQRYIERFIVRYRGALNAMPTAFFAVSGSAGSRNEKEREAAEHILRAFLERTGWRPRLTASIAGAITFTKYGWFTRWMMKRISRLEGGGTDTSRDYEYTDWDQVAQFADSCFAMVATPAEAAPNA
ncbi:MAG: flavodoxin domain-containing protein [Gemmatimonadaceae bacterium]|nr:flavodoxin domain-containing protein [Gemmatimonadaceae bacterium]